MDWDRLELVLFNLDKYLFIGYFILLIAAIRFEKKVSSVLITFTVVAVTNGVMTSLVPLLYKIAANDGIVYKFAWYGSFCLIDALAIYLLFKFHNMLKQSVSAVAELAGFAFVLLATLQSIFFVEQYLFLSSYTRALYQYGIPLINIALMPAMIFFWVMQNVTFRQKRYGVS
ncbi:MAG TPA: hypothetical protein VIN66_18590 [Rheinheimera sp.]|uniref:hypothetical protein n=1 Tax=Rheinheimera sp. TaxID=1869214 RepID=UPI002F93844E